MNHKRIKLPSSFISNTKTTDSSPAFKNVKQESAFRKRELLEQIIEHEEFLEIPGIYECFPYKAGYPLPELAKKRLQSRGVFYTRHCGNRHACPVCASHHMAKKREHYIALAQDHEGQGGYLVTQILTLRHSSAQETAKKYIDLNGNWSKMLNNSAFKNARFKAKSPEYVKVLEEVLNDNGWFPHLHIIWFFNKETTKKQSKMFLESVTGIWVQTANKFSEFGSNAKGLKAKYLTKGSTRSTGWYIFKHGFYLVGQNIRNKIVSGTNYSLSPFEVFMLYFETGEVPVGLAWSQFQLATKGLIRVKFSKKLTRKITRLT